MSVWTVYERIARECSTVLKDVERTDDDRGMPPAMSIQTGAVQLDSIMIPSNITEVMREHGTCSDMRVRFFQTNRP